MSRRDDPPQAAPVRRADQPFVSRWSQRKLARTEGAQPTNVPDGPAAAQANEQTERAALTDADMPPLEQLDANSDYSMFFSPKVSDELRGLALRQLFRSAQFNLCDGLDDYAEDFTTFAALGDVLTADIRHRLKVQAEKALQGADDVSDDHRRSEDESRTAATHEHNDQAQLKPSDAHCAADDAGAFDEENPA